MNKNQRARFLTFVARSTKGRGSIDAIIEGKGISEVVCVKKWILSTLCQHHF